MRVVDASPRDLWGIFLHAAGSFFRCISDDEIF